jgi:transposase
MGYLQGREGIEAIIHIRKNAYMKMRGGRSLDRWRFAKRYGRRLMVQGAFSAIKRMLGDGLRSRRDDRRLRKAVAYTMFLMA